MDINKDQATPSGDMIKFDDGKYFTKDPISQKFDVDKFNLYFDQYKERRKKEMKDKLNRQLEELNKPQEKTPIYLKSIPAILVDTKDTMFDMFDDVLVLKLDKETFTKNNRLFYIGVVFLIVVTILYLYYVLSGWVTDSDNNSSCHKSKYDFKVLHDIVKKE